MMKAKGTANVYSDYLLYTIIAKFYNVDMILPEYKKLVMWRIRHFNTLH